MKYEIVHEVYVDEMGIKRDSLECVKTNNDGSRVIKPFLGKIKPRIITKDTSLNDVTEQYTQEDYDEMLEEHSGF
jgi:hypothetical protein